MRSLLGSILNKTPVPYVGSGRLSFAAPSRNDAEAQMRAMGAVGTLFGIVNRTSTAAASVNWRLWRKARSGKVEDRVEVTSHAALDVWNQPNEFYTRQEFVETEQQHIDLTGEGWWVIGRDPRSPLPLELWPVRPDRIEPVPHPTDFISGYVYRGPDGEKVPLGRDEVIQIKMPNPLDPYRGMGPVQSILLDLDGVRLSAEWNMAFFRNGAEPGGIIEVDRELSDAEFAQMRERWREQHQGVANAHRVAVLEAGRWVDRKITQRDMQFVELRGVSRDAIREAFGISKFAVGDLDDVNRATADAAKAWFAEQMTVPRLDRFKQALNNDYLPLFGASDVEFDYDDPIPENSDANNSERDSKVAAAVALKNAGWDPAEVLATLGLPEILFGMPGGDPDRDLLVDLVKGAPSLATIILPMLGFELPETAAPEPGPPPAATEPEPAAV